MYKHRVASKKMLLVKKDLFIVAYPLGLLFFCHQKCWKYTGLCMTTARHTSINKCISFLSACVFLFFVSLYLPSESHESGIQTEQHLDTALQEYTVTLFQLKIRPTVHIFKNSKTRQLHSVSQSYTEKLH